MEISNQIRRMTHQAIPEIDGQDKYKQAFYALYGE
jgi:hypothetical protein